MTVADDVLMPSVLRAKMRVPARPAHYVRRARLFAFLDELVEHPVTLVAAPAGAGKTALLAGWVAERPEPTAWLSLDDADREPLAFWIDVIAALETMRAGCGERAMQRVRDGRPVVEVVYELIDALAEFAPDLVPDATDVRGVLVVDDLQCLGETDDAHDTLGLFVRHLPDWLRVVLVSRRSPEIHLDRLRGRGLLGELRFRELRFSAEEAEELLTRLAPGLDPSEVRALAAPVDGLAAGLQVVALGVRSSSHRKAGDVATDFDSMMRHFVFHDALEAEDADLVDVLAKVSIVERVNRSLAVALTGRTDADDVLCLAEQRGLFLTAVDAAGWFEIHAPARAALVAELERRAPEMLLEQHVRAARWYEENEDIPLALEHLLLAGKPRDALRLLAARQAGLYDAGRVDAIARTIDRIPLEVAVADLDAMVDYARCNVVLNRRRFLDAVEQAAWHARYAPSLPPRTEGRLLLVRSQAAFIAGDFGASGKLARESLAVFGDEWWRDPCGRLGWNMIAREIAFAEGWSENDTDVREARLSLTRTPDRRLAYEGTRALGEALSGRPLDALRIVAGTRRAADVSAMTVLRTELEMAEAIATRELGDAERAAQLLEAIAARPTETMLFCSVLARCELVALHLDQGDVGAAAEVHEQAERIVEVEAFGPSVRDWVARAGVQRALQRGHVDEAQRAVAAISDTFWGPVLSARAHLGAGNVEHAVVALDAARSRCVRHEVVLEIARALAADDREDAAKLVARAIKVAAPNGMLQTIAAEGTEILDLVEHAACDVPPAWLDRLRRTAVVRTRGIARSQELIDPLTDRELDVLRFLPSRLTIREIAAELYVSVNTLKFHLRMIYRKLGVSSRAEAAAYARRLLDVRR